MPRKPVHGPPPLPADRAVPTAPPEQWTNLFAPAQGMKLPSRLPAANGKSGSQGPRTAFVLVGTIVSSNPASRRAILWANGMKDPKAFREKEEVEPGAFLSSVERDKVWLTRGSEREMLELLPVGSKTRGSLSPPVAGPRSAPPGAPQAAGTRRPRRSATSAWNAWRTTGSPSTKRGWSS